MQKRWIQLGSAVIAMIMIANLQYAWTLFVVPMQQATRWTTAAIGLAFTLFIAFETWVTPVEGWLIDRLGPRIFLSLGGVLCGIGWTLLGYSRSLRELYVLYSIAGVGAAFVYSGSIATALKWFPDRRGFASGLTTAGFGAGAALSIPLISFLIRTQSYRQAFLYTGIAQGLIILIAAQVLHNPGPDFHVEKVVKTVRDSKVRRNTVKFNSLQMLTTPQFYLLYITFVMINVGGLMLTAQAGPVARSFNITTAALTAALVSSRLSNGAGRIFWGWISDRLGREMAMFIPYSLQAICLLAVLYLGRLSGTWFTISMLVLFFIWGSMFALFPAIIGDYFGADNATSNYGFLYTAKGVASILAGVVAGWVFQKFGSWNYVFYGSAVLALLASATVLVVKRMPLPSRERTEGELIAAKAS